MDTARLVQIWISFLFCLKGINALEYADLVTMGIDCPSSISCDAIDSTNFSRRNCECDRDCAIYHDCCINAKFDETSRNRKSSAFMCMPVDGKPNVGAYVIQTCSKDYIGSSEIQHKCLYHQSTVSDPLMTVPVTDTVSNISYRNSYCAECNNVDISNLKSWMIQMDCGFNSTVDVSNDFSYQNLHYDSKWRVKMNNRSHTCDMKYGMPEYLLNNIRLCRSNVVSECPSNWDAISLDTWTRMMVKLDCKSYTAIMFVTNSDKVYKNPHCALCNGIEVEDMKCVRDELAKEKKRFVPREKRQAGGKNTSNFFIGISHVSIEENQRKMCGQNQVYDRFAKKCRNIYRPRIRAFR